MRPYCTQTANRPPLQRSKLHRYAATVIVLSLLVIVTSEPSTARPYGYGISEQKAARSRKATTTSTANHFDESTRLVISRDDDVAIFLEALKGLRGEINSIREDLLKNSECVTRSKQYNLNIKDITPYLVRLRELTAQIDRFSKRIESSAEEGQQKDSRTSELEALADSFKAVLDDRLIRFAESDTLQGVLSESIEKTLKQSRSDARLSELLNRNRVLIYRVQQAGDRSESAQQTILKHLEHLEAKIDTTQTVTESLPETSALKQIGVGFLAVMLSLNIVAGIVAGYAGYRLFRAGG